MDGRQVWVVLTIGVLMPQVVGVFDDRDEAQAAAARVVGDVLVEKAPHL